MTQSTVRVLVIDDDPLQLELVERGLSRDGFDVRCVDTFPQMQAEARGFAPDIVLVDVNMPDAPDERLVAGIRDAAPGVRVVLYSAWEDSKLRLLVRQLGADAFLSKSESVAAIGQRLRELQRG